MSDAATTPYAPFPDEPAYDLDENQGEYSRGPFLFLVALIVLAAFGGVVYVAYQQGLREGQRTPPPTIAARPGPIREKPADPGGLEEPYQDTLVLNGDETASEVAILDGPEEPLARPMPAEEKPEEPVSVEEAIAAEGQPTIADLIDESRTVDAEAALSMIDVDNDAKAAQEMAEAKPPVAEPIIIEPSKPVVRAPAFEESRVVIASPSAQPKEQVELADVPSVPEPSEADMTQVTGSLNVSAGSWVVQVASVKDDEAQARNKLQSVRQKHGPTLASLGLEVKRADLGDKGIYYRVRVGPFTDKTGANAICQELKGQGQDCFVAKP